jgi:FkbM family methyltransferase
MYSQNNEEIVIHGELERLGIITGSFLDIGAWDGIGFSNTFRLAELGWGGVCVEPSPMVFPKLVRNYENNDKIKLVNAAISPTKAEVSKWFDSGGDAISTTSPEHKDKWESGFKVKYTGWYIFTMPVEALLHAFGFDFEVINIDVEGTNYALFLAMPWHALKKTRIICVEHDNHYQAMADVVATFGFQRIGLNGENIIFSR